MESEDLAVRVKKFSEGKINWGPPAQFVRRELLWENEITFPNTSTSEDFPFAFFVLCSAKTFVYLPDAVHIYRIHADSTFHKRRTVQELIHRFGDFFIGVEAFEKFMRKFELFQKQPEYKYMLFDLFARNCGIEPIALNLYSQFSAAQLDNAIRAELEQIEETTGLTTYLFSRMSIFNLKLYQYTQIINRQQAQIQQLQAQLQQK